MGTDIFLFWDGMSKSERDVQLKLSESSSLEAGEVGYIRAAIGMRRENGFLGFVFPDEYWFNKTGRPIPYDFDMMLPKMKSGSEEYLKSAREGSVPGFGEAYQRAVALDIATKIQMRRRGYEVVRSTRDLGYEDAVAWLKSVWRFFDLGVRIQNQGRHPSVLISW